MFWRFPKKTWKKTQNYNFYTFERWEKFPKKFNLLLPEVSNHNYLLMENSRNFFKNGPYTASFSLLFVFAIQ